MEKPPELNHLNGSIEALQEKKSAIMERRSIFKELEPIFTKRSRVRTPAEADKLDKELVLKEIEIF